VRREFKEETGLEISEFSAEPGWTTVFDLPLIAHIKVLKSSQTAEALHARILDYLARDKQPELADIRIVRGTSDFTAAMPRFVTSFLEQHFAVR
jgi:8-oxo-dGTP pyrophosphatase MutT (NUDIX family)